MKKSVAVAWAIALCLITLLVSRTEAWFVAYEEQANTTVAPQLTTESVKPTVEKILESSKEHANSVLQDLRKNSGAKAAGAPPPVEPTTDPGPVTKDYWDSLPEWLPPAVRAEFLDDNDRFLRRSRHRTPKPIAVIETKDYWEELPGWLPDGVRQEFMRDNAEYARRSGRNEAAVTTTAEPPADHVTRNYWNHLPDWLPPKVRAAFHSDNREFLRWRGLMPTTPAPTVEHVTKDSWDAEQLPTWLSPQIREEFFDGNDGPKRKTLTSTAPKPIENRISEPGGPPPAGAVTEATLPPWLVEMLSSTTTIQPTTVEEMQSVSPRQKLMRERNEIKRSKSLGGAPDLSITQPLLPTPAPDPTRLPITVSSSKQLPPKCSRQVNWVDQPKCSASRSKWTFNLLTLRCEWFAYYGCQLNNGNIFNSRRDCESYCIKGIVNPCESSKCEPVYSLYRSDCFLLHDTACINSILQQYSHIGSPTMRLQMAQEQITLFCQPPTARCLNTGINARLPSYESPPTYEEDEEDKPSHCNLPPDRGSCPSSQRIRMSRVFYYSKRHNQCKFMMHFGCGGNLNRFANLADCYNNCGI